MPATHTMTMYKTKETKGTIVFTEDLDETDPPTERERPHTFYILKETHEVLGDPEMIKVTIDHI